MRVRRTEMLPGLLALWQPEHTLQWSFSSRVFPMSWADSRPPRRLATASPHPTWGSLNQPNPKPGWFCVLGRHESHQTFSECTRQIGDLGEGFRPLVARWPLPLPLSTPVSRSPLLPPAQDRESGNRIKPSAVHVRAKSLQLALTLCNPMDCSRPGSSAHGILQAIILEWVATPFLQGILLTQGLNLCLLCFLFWRECSVPLMPPGNRKPNVVLPSKNAEYFSWREWTIMNKSFSSPLLTNKDKILEYILLMANDCDRKSWKNRFMISLCVKQSREQLKKYL